MANLNRVVITGMGVVSSIGNNLDEVDASLRTAKSGIEFCQEYADLGFRSHVCGFVSLRPAEHIEKRILRFMGDGAAWNYIAMQEAIKHSGLEDKEVKHERTGMIMGSGGPSTKALHRAATITLEKSPKRVGPFAVPACMSSTNSATIATPFGIRGLSYSISSACSTSAHCIGSAAEQIQMGKQDVMFAGGGEELDWTLSVLFDAMPALSSGYNDRPQAASRAFDRNRDGFVIAGGAGVVVLEELEHARARGATLIAELVAYGANSDGFDMVQPSGEGSTRCMRMARSQWGGKIDYINAHGTSTPVGDGSELKAVREVFGEEIPPISSTKSMTGHSLGAAGVQETIYSLLMMQGGYLTKSLNFEEPDEVSKDFPILKGNVESADVNSVLTNSFGFGGVNTSLIFSRV